MPLDATANFVRGETDAAVDATQTTVSVVDASIFPDPSTEGEYNVVIWDAASHPRPDQDPDVEILRVTARDTGTNDLTVTRGQEGTSGASHPSGSAIHLSPTAKMFGDIEATFNDFWDATNQELTADLNNGQATIGSTRTTHTFPPEPVDVSELDDSSPPSSYTTLSLSGPDANAQYAILNVELQGDGTNDNMRFLAKEGGSSDFNHVELRGWAGHGAFSAAASCICPINNNQEIEYFTNRVARVIVETKGYF